MAKSNEKIKNEIEDFVNKNGGGYEDYYIGITNNLTRRITERAIYEHIRSGIYTKGNALFEEECRQRIDAVSIEQYFQDKGMLKLNRRAMGVKDSRFIYCFKLDAENKSILLNENLSGPEKMRTWITDFSKYKIKFKR